MKIASYNVNGIRAAMNKGFVQWLQIVSPDVICLQEIKATSDQIDIDQFHRQSQGFDRLQINKLFELSF